MRLETQEAARRQAEDVKRARHAAERSAEAAERSASAFEKSVLAANEALIAQQRPLLELDTVQHPAAHDFIFRVKNSGKTPALAVRCMFI